MISKTKVNTLAVVAFGVLIALTVVVLRAEAATVEGASARPVAAPSAAQVQAFPALGRPSGALPSAWARTFASIGQIEKRFAPNADLARAIPSPRSGGAPWYIIPGNDSVCLVTEDTGACQSTAVAQAGGLLIEFIQPNQASRTTPMPPPGAPVESTVYGVAPAGVDSVQATTLRGEKVRGRVANGIYTVRGTDMARLDLRGHDQRRGRHRDRRSGSEGAHGGTARGQLRPSFRVRRVAAPDRFRAHADEFGVDRGTRR